MKTDDAVTLAVEIIQAFCDDTDDCTVCPFYYEENAACNIACIKLNWQSYLAYKYKGVDG